MAESPHDDRVSELPAPKRRNLIRAFWGIRNLLWWAYPLVLCAISFAFGAMRLPVSETARLAEMGLQVDLLVILLFSVGLAVIWVLWEFFGISNQGVPIRHLRANSAISILVALLFTATSIYLLAVSHFYWALLVPWVASVIDAFISSDRAINNAAQKPFVENVRPQ